MGSAQRQWHSDPQVLKAWEAAAVRQTTTFFVNGKPLLSFGAQPLIDLVKAEIEQSK
ncbi:hypothetical protein [Ectopseudomonas hydrolytica]|uniref:hypothetical protein n=1 Tax=Ectopseudomonas hydrolytica TaxID=2493633 RepID=UPI003C2C59E0